MFPQSREKSNVCIRVPSARALRNELPCTFGLGVEGGKFSLVKDSAGDCTGLPGARPQCVLNVFS